MTTPDVSMKPTPAPTLAPRSKAPLVILGLLSAASFVGPFVIFLTIRGGERDSWPPDRPVEWATLGGVTTLVLGLMLGCVTSGKWAGTKKTT